MGGIMSLEIQKVWRTMSASFDGGFRVWEITEVIGEPSFDTEFILKCIDGSSIYVTCWHSWTEEKATELYYVVDSEWQEYIRV